MPRIASEVGRRLSGWASPDRGRPACKCGGGGGLERRGCAAHAGLRSRANPVRCLPARWHAKAPRSGLPHPDSLMSCCWVRKCAPLSWWQLRAATAARCAAAHGTRCARVRPQPASAFVREQVLRFGSASRARARARTRIRARFSGSGSGSVSGSGSGSRWARPRPNRRDRDRDRDRDRGRRRVRGRGRVRVRGRVRTAETVWRTSASSIAAHVRPPRVPCAAAQRAAVAACHCHQESAAHSLTLWHDVRLSGWASPDRGAFACQPAGKHHPGLARERRPACAAHPRRSKPTATAALARGPTPVRACPPRRPPDYL